MAVSNQEVVLNVASNGQSSSILQFGSHQNFYANIKFVDKVVADLQSVDDWMDQVGAIGRVYDFVSIDVQGYESEALLGMRR